MGLLKCVDCNKDMSDRADTCPHCGGDSPALVALNEQLNIDIQKHGGEAVESECPTCNYNGFMALVNKETRTVTDPLVGWFWIIVTMPLWGIGFFLLIFRICSGGSRSSEITRCHTMCPSCGSALERDFE